MNILRQTPAEKGVWDNITFTETPIEECDYVILLNRALVDTSVNCPPEHVWAIIQEPPNEVSGWLHYGDPSYARVYTNNEFLQGKHYVVSQPAIPWYVNRNYDYLVQCCPSEKRRDLSWITSNLTVIRGHRKRMKFLHALQDQIRFDLFGYGFNPIEDKWDGLAPYRYSLAVENSVNNYYWSEKISDCFLAWTMPIYYGCKRILDYFPEEAMVHIDIDDPDCIEQVREAVESSRWKKNQEAIAFARQLVLERYQLFPFIAGEIHAHARDCHALGHENSLVFLPATPRGPFPVIERMRRFWRRLTPNNLRRTIAKIRFLFE